MITFEFETVKHNVYRLIVKDSNKIVDVLERFDDRGERTAKIGLFSFVHPVRLSLNNDNIDKFLFL